MSDEQLSLDLSNPSKESELFLKPNVTITDSDWLQCTKCGERFHWIESGVVFGVGNNLWHATKPWPELDHCGPLEWI